MIVTCYYPIFRIHLTSRDLLPLNLGIRYKFL
jgi:hypothetical protein